MAPPNVGDKAQDTITGFRGTITAQIRYLEPGREQVLLEGIDAQGKPVELWVSTSRIADPDAGIPPASVGNSDAAEEG